MDRLEGDIYLPKEPTHLNERTGFPLTISYCAQQPWLEHSKRAVYIIPRYLISASRIDQGEYVSFKFFLAGRCRVSFASLFRSPFDKERYDLTLS